MRTPKAERGAALLSVLLLVAVMAVLAAASLDRLKLATKLASNGAAIEQARSYASAAELVAKYRIGDLIQRNAGKTTLEGDWAGRPTNFPIDGGIATARLDDGGNCFNLNSLVTQATDGTLMARPQGVLQFQHLIELTGIAGRDAANIAAAAADWIDTDTNPLPGGAEDAAYTNAKPARRTANALMVDPSELRAVAGVTTDLYTQIRPFICTLPVADLSAINVNTLRVDQAPLLSMVLPGLDVQRARGTIDARPAAGFDNVSQFWALPQLTAVPPASDTGNQIRIRSQWFSIALTIELADAELEEHALFDAREKPAKIVRRSFGELG